jgi:hypothetical protein
MMELGATSIILRKILFKLEKIYISNRSRDIDNHVNEHCHGKQHRVGSWTHP